MLDSGRSARVYEAAVSGGQFFFMSGLLIILTAAGRHPSGWRLALGGVLWALALGARPDLVIPIGLAVLILSLCLLATEHWSVLALTKLIPLIVPLAFSGALLSWYNWARFGSPLETGYYYQLTTLHLQQNWNARFSLAYVLPNLYTYIVGPAAITADFPYLHATYVRPPTALFGGGRPDFYASQWTTCALWIIPFAVFGVIAVAMALVRLFGRQKPVTNGEPAQPRFPDWITLMFGGTCIAAFGFLLLYFWTAMRFMEEFVPCLVILSIIGFWQGYQMLERKRAWRRFYSIAGSLLATTSIVASLLLAMSALTARIPLHQLFPFLK
jgi:hypothetical protein